MVKNIKLQKKTADFQLKTCDLRQKKMAIQGIYCGTPAAGTLQFLTGFFYFLKKSNYKNTVNILEKVNFT